MTKKIDFKKIGSRFIVLSMIKFALFGSVFFAQTLQRQCIGSAGSFASSDGTLIQQTVGQPYSTATNYSGGVAYRPGFQQPVIKIDLIHANVQLDVFPNPAVNWVTLKSSKILTGVEINVFDVIGQLVLKEKQPEFKSFSFNCETWINGTYILSLIDEKGANYTAKLIVSK